MARWKGRRLKIATIGCGRMGANTSPSMARFAPPHLRVLSHMEAARNLGLASALAGADISDEVLEKARKRHALDAVATDYRALIAEFRPDIVTIATRTPEKGAIIRFAVEAGVKALHVEKPLCNSAAELAGIERLVRAKGVLLTSGCLRRYLAPFRDVPALFAREGLGVPDHVLIGMGRASLMWTEFHAIDLILHYAGEDRLDWVRADLGETEWDGDRTVTNDPLVISAHMQFASGFSGSIAPISGNTTIVSAPMGQVELFADGRNVFLARRTDPVDAYVTKTEISLASGSLSGTEAPLWYLARALEEDTEALAVVRQGAAGFLAAQKVVFALVESHRAGGARIALDRFESSLTVLGTTDGRHA